MPRLAVVVRQRPGMGHPHGSGIVAYQVEDELAKLDAAAPSGALPDGFELTAVMPHEEWKDLVARAVKEMEGGSLSKVVLARQVEVVANRPFVLPETLARLAHLYPSCAVFHVEGFLGASPETLLRRTGDGDREPSAGRHGGPQRRPCYRRRSGGRPDVVGQGPPRAPAGGGRDRGQTAAVRRRWTCQRRLRYVPLRNVSHLGTSIKGTLTRTTPVASGGRPTAPGPGQRLTGTGSAPQRSAQGQAAGAGLPASLELAALLQPTPAVGGLPVECAIQWQRDNEGFDRGCYAGPVGWVDRTGTANGCSACAAPRSAGNRAVYVRRQRHRGRF